MKGREDELEVMNASLKTLYYLLDTCETITCVLFSEVHTLGRFQTVRW